jgi:hypothetical protein
VTTLAQHPKSFLGVASAAALVGGCAGEPAGLSAWMDDSEVREVVAAEFPSGLTLEETHARLNSLKVSRKHRLLYEATESRPQVLLVRFFRNGFWLHQERETVKWLDLSFVFGGERDTLTSVLLFRDDMDYFQGGPIDRPRRAVQGSLRRWPGPIPPPADPLEGAN